MGGHFTINYHDDQPSSTRTILVRRRGKPDFEMHLDLGELSMYSDPGRAMYGLARREIERREAGQLLPDRRHEVRNFA